MSGILCLTWNNHYSAFLKLFSALLVKDSFSDATIVCHGKYFPVHQLVLSTCSEYFQEIFEQAKCKHPFIVLKDVKPQELEALLSYMYKGVVNVSQELLSDFIKAAEGLKIKGLAVPDDVPIAKNERKRTLFSAVSPHPKRKKGIEEKEKASFINNPQCLKQTPQLNSDDKSAGSNLNERQLEVEKNNSNTVQSSMFKEELGLDTLELSIQSTETGLNALDGIKEEFDSNASYPEEILSENVLSSMSLPAVPSVGMGQEGSVMNGSDSQNYWNGCEDKEESDTNLDVIRGLLPTSGFLSLSQSLYPQQVSCGQTEDSSPQPIIPNSISNFLNWELFQVQDVNNSSFRCPKCPYEAKKKYNLKSHYMYKHTNERPLGCRMCAFRCVLKSDLRRHMIRHAKKNKFLPDFQSLP